MTRTLPWRRITLQEPQMRRTDARTFIFLDSYFVGPFSDGHGRIADDVHPDTQCGSELGRKAKVRWLRCLRE